MKVASKIILKVLGILLLTAAVLKGWQLLTEPVANNDIWSYRPFLILTVEFELALAIWLLSGLFKKAAWLATLMCFSAFSAITLYKGITGAESCGCFGPVHVNPWITLFAIELPAVIALSIFRPRLSFSPVLSFLRKKESMKALIVEFITPLPSPRRFVTAVAIGFTVLGVTTPILAFNEPAMVTSSYEVIEPETWVGKKLPILEHIDIAESLRKGTWLVLLYHYDCHDCAVAIPKYEKIARDLAGNEDFLRIALIEVPPYGQGSVSENCPCTLGQLAETKEWFVTTPAVALLTDGNVISAWEEKAPDLETIIQNHYCPVKVLENCCKPNKFKPETWVGRKLPILEHIDIAESLKKGTWVVLLYHYDCHDCAVAIPKYENMARDLEGNEDFLRIALIAVPPYGRAPVSENCPCTLGRLAETKEWFVTIPAVTLLSDGNVISAWEEKAPDFETLFEWLT